MGTQTRDLNSNFLVGLFYSAVLDRLRKFSPVRTGKSTHVASTGQAAAGPEAVLFQNVECAFQAIWISFLPNL